MVENDPIGNFTGSPVFLDLYAAKIISIAFFPLSPLTNGSLPSLILSITSLKRGAKTVYRIGVSFLDLQYIVFIIKPIGEPASLNLVYHKTFNGYSTFFSKRLKVSSKF